METMVLTMVMLLAVSVYFSLLFVLSDKTQ